MKEVPGIRPTKPGTRLGESRRFRRVVRNVYTHSFDLAKLGKLVNAVPELFAPTKAVLHSAIVYEFRLSRVISACQRNLKLGGSFQEPSVLCFVK
jgi:hypothetical protein